MMSQDKKAIHIASPSRFSPSTSSIGAPSRSSSSAIGAPSRSCPSSPIGAPSRSSSSSALTAGAGGSVGLGAVASVNVDANANFLNFDGAADASCAGRAAWTSARSAAAAAAEESGASVGRCPASRSRRS